MRVTLRVTFLHAFFMKYKLTLERRKKNGIVIEENMPIRITVNHMSQRITLSTGYRVDLVAWNSKDEIVKHGYINKNGNPYNIINSKIKEQTTFLDRQNLLHEMDNTEIDLEKLKIDFAEKFTRKKNIKHVSTEIELTFFDVLDLFIEKSGQQNDWTKATFSKFKTVKNHLQCFDEKLSFPALSEEKLIKYQLYLRDKAHLQNSTIKKQIKNLKWFLNWAVEKGYCTNTTYRSFNPKLKIADNQVVYLKKEELEKIRTFEIPPTKQYLDRIRDVFLFSCYTALRYSDVYRLKRSNVIDERIDFITKKTSDKLGIKLSARAIQIMEKYNNHSFEDDKTLPVISNQKMNVYIKELCKLAKIESTITKVYFKGNKRIDQTFSKHQLICTHTARRTFICNALANGMPPHAVMKITGHKDFKAMQPYIDIVGKDLDNMIDKYLDF